MNRLVIRDGAKIGRSVRRVVAVVVLGGLSVNMTGCGLDLGDIVTGITSNVCVLAGGCNGGTKM